MPDLPRALLLHPNEGCASLARELVRRGVEVHLLSPPGTEWLTVRGTRAHQVPALPAGADDWLATLDALSDRPGVLLSASDLACELLCRRRAEIDPILRSFESAGSKHLALMDKHTLYTTAREAGVRSPWTHRIDDRETLERLAVEMRYPCVVKGVMGHEAKGSGHRTTRVDSVAELRLVAGAAVDDGHSVLATELVPGAESGIEGAVSVRAAERGYTLMYGRRKLRQYPLDYGVGSLVVGDHVPDTIRLARRLLDHVGFVGFSSVETKRHATTGEVVLIEVNVRLPQNFGLARANDSDGSWRLYATLAGLELEPAPTPRVGTKVVLPHIDALAVRERVRRDDLSLRDALRDLRGVRDGGAFSLRDPGPGLLALRRMAGEWWQARRAR